MTGDLSIWHWLIVLLALALVGIPMARILKRAGHSPWWAIVYFLPLVNLAALWIFAFARWPALEGTRSTNPE